MGRYATHLLRVLALQDNRECRSQRSGATSATVSSMASRRLLPTFLAIAAGIPEPHDGGNRRERATRRRGSILSSAGIFSANGPSDIRAIFWLMPRVAPKQIENGIRAVAERPIDAANSMIPRDMTASLFFPTTLSTSGACFVEATSGVHDIANRRLYAVDNPRRAISASSVHAKAPTEGMPVSDAGSIVIRSGIQPQAVRASKWSPKAVPARPHLCSG